MIVLYWDIPKKVGELYHRVPCVSNSTDTLNQDWCIAFCLIGRAEIIRMIYIGCGTTCKNIYKKYKNIQNNKQWDCVPSSFENIATSQLLNHAFSKNYWY